MILNMGLIVWNSIGKAVIFAGCLWLFFECTVSETSWLDTQLWPLETACFSYQVKRILGASDYNLCHYYNNTDTATSVSYCELTGFLLYSHLNS